MLEVRFRNDPCDATALALPVVDASAGGAATGDGPALAAGLHLIGSDLSDVTSFLAEVERPGTAGAVQVLPRPGQTPRRLLLFGIGGGDEAGWRAAGAAIARAASGEAHLAVALPAGPAALVEGLAEGLWLAGYQFTLTEVKGGDAPRLNEVSLLGPASSQFADAYPRALEHARSVAKGTLLARDLTNTPSDRKTPEWLAGQIVEAATGVPGLTAEVWGPDRLAEERFEAVLAVGRASSEEPRLVRLHWGPPEASKHVVLVGKGVTFDTGGICVKPLSSMKLMRKDMGGAAAALCAARSAAELRLPVRVTALAPLVENSLGGDAMRPGDVVRHRNGLTSEVLNTDAEGRLILADTLAYAATELEPDILIDLATLTGAQSVALGKRTAALFTEADELADSIAEAAAAAGESVWRLPLVDDYGGVLDSDLADLANVPFVENPGGGAGAVAAALYLREFTGAARARWAHLDMSAPAWSDSAAGELSKGATGWGVRTLLRWLESIASEPTPG